MNRNEGNTPVFEPERKLYLYETNVYVLTELDKKPWPVEQSISWDLYSKYSKPGLTGCEVPPQSP